ncbi:MAG: ATP-binding protein [Verrucomicrobiae bacterium]|nr:ATP-binding protein [Verrucomicrobiae bacterium]
MRYLSRILEGELKSAARNFPALILTGPRRAGKTTLLRRLFPKADYVLLEDPDQIARASADPRGFLDGLRLPVLLDEIQNQPALFNYIRTRIDREPHKRGQWLLTGSQEASLMRGVTESMAGRAAVFQLLPLSAEESPHVSPLRGGFPEVLARPSAANAWFRSYIQTYLERDVRAVAAIRNLALFRRFLGLLTSRVGQMLNKTDLAAPLGVSVPTITEWIGILEVTGQILLVPPFYENFGKRLIKSPKLYFMDSGLACHLLGIRDERTLRASPFLGPVFEGFVASEISKHRLSRGLERGLYWFRDQQGLEVDFVVDRGGRRLLLLEAKATHTPVPQMATPLTRLVYGIGRYTSEAFLVHEDRGSATDPVALSPGVKATGRNSLHRILGA